MHISAGLSVKDEVELIGPCIDHLLAIGVDQIFVVDVNSSDGTKDVIATRLSERVRLIEVDDQLSTPFEWQLNDALKFMRDNSTGWLLFQDADEFWLPVTGSLKDVSVLKNADYDVITVSRFNTCLHTDGRNLIPTCNPDLYNELLLFAGQPVEFRERLDENMTAWSEGIPVAKVIVRADRMGSISTGGHSVASPDGRPIREGGAANELIIAHLPFTTEARFRRKVANASRFLRLHAGDSPDPAWQGKGTGWHWRRWAEIQEKGDISLEFQRQIFSTEKIELLRGAGLLKTVAELFEAPA